MVLQEEYNVSEGGIHCATIYCVMQNEINVHNITSFKVDNI